MVRVENFLLPTFYFLLFTSFFLLLFSIFYLLKDVAVVALGLEVH